MQVTEKDFVRLYSKALVGDGCWEWQATKRGDGYGAFSFGRHSDWYAHRASWLLWNGPIPPGTWVLHHCDNKACIRPDHLYLGDGSRNARDRVERGQHVSGLAGRTRCKSGHPFDEDNTYLYRGNRLCKMCRNIWKGRSHLNPRKVI